MNTPVVNDMNMHDSGPPASGLVDAAAELLMLNTGVSAKP